MTCRKILKSQMKHNMDKERDTNMMNVSGADCLYYIVNLGTYL